MPLGVEPSQQISIHALREEGDFANLGEQAILKKISIHALREEGDLALYVRQITQNVFLFTPSARRATRLEIEGKLYPLNFYSRPPRGGRQVSKNLTAEACTFLFTPSARRATFNRMHKTNLRYISIHALREEGDPIT